MHYSLVVKGVRVVKGVKVNTLAASYHHSAFGFFTLVLHSSLNQHLDFSLFIFNFSLRPAPVLHLELIVSLHVGNLLLELSYLLFLQHALVFYWHHLHEVFNIVVPVVEHGACQL